MGRGELERIARERIGPQAVAPRWRSRSPAARSPPGGCRSLASDGRTWQCYVGHTAVDQQIIGDSLLGQHSSGPGVG